MKSELMQSPRYILTLQKNLSPSPVSFTCSENGLTGSSEILVHINHTICSHTPEHSNLNTGHCENFISYMKRDGKPYK